MIKKADNKGKVLKSFLEEILFNKDDFTALKTLINSLHENKIQPKDLRKIIIEQRFKILENLLGFIPFQIKYEVEQGKVNNFAENGRENNFHQKLCEELEEKEALLEKIAQRVFNISTQLENK